MRAQIINGAMDQIRVGGYAGLNFAGIADSLGTTRANLHHHFKNKEGLATEATRLYIAQSMEFVEGLAETHPTDFAGFLAAIEAAVVGGSNQTTQARNCVCSQLITDSSSPGSLIDLSREFFVQKRKLMKQVIRASQESGKIVTTISAEVLADRASALLMGLAQSLLVSDDTQRLSGSFETILTDWVTPYRLQ